MDQFWTDVLAHPIASEWIKPEFTAERNHRLDDMNREIKKNKRIKLIISRQRSATSSISSGDSAKSNVSSPGVIETSEMATSDRTKQGQEIEGEGADSGPVNKRSKRSENKGAT